MKHSLLSYPCLFGSLATALCQLGCSDAAGVAEQDVQSIESAFVRYQSTHLWPQGDIPVCWEGEPAAYVWEK
jgi:hypothetical protein